MVKRGIGSGAGTQVPAFLQELEHRRRHLHNDPESLNNGLSHELFKQTSSGFPFKGRIIVQKALFGVPCQGDQGLLAQATLALFNAPFGVPFQVEGLALEPKIVKATSFGVSFEVDQFPETGQEQIPCLLLFKLRGLGA